MATADTNRIDLRFREETTWGEAIPTSGNDWTQIRLTGSSLEHQKTSEGSETIRSDRMVDSVAELGVTATGSIDFELAQGGLLSFIEGLIGGTRATPGTRTTTISSVTNANVLGVADDLTGDLAIGQYISVFGTTGGTAAQQEAANDIWRVTAVTSGTITVEAKQGGASIATAITGGTVAVSTMIRNGSTARSYQVAQRMTDVGDELFFNGMRVGSMSFDITAQSRITGSVGFDGRRGQFLTGITYPSLTTLPFADPLSASANASAVQIVGTSSGFLTNPPLIQQISIDINGNNRQKTAVGDKYSIDVGQGRVDMTGSMNLYFQDTEAFDMMENHEYFSLSIPFREQAGRGFVITFPKVVFTGGSPTAPGGNQDVFESKTFQAVNDTGALGGATGVGYAIQFDDIPIS